ncbi:hypothetical protein [Bacillus sp. AK128]
MSMLTFLPLFIFLIVLTLVFVPAFSPMLKSKRIGFLAKVNLKWLSGVYCLILLVSLLTFYLLPSDIFSYTDEEFGKLNLDDVDYNTNIIYDALYKGKIEEVEEVNINEQWEFSYSGELLTINMNEDQTSMLVIAERSSELNGKIEATHYTSKAFIQGIDFSDQLHPPTVELDGEELNIKDPESIELKFFKLQKEFVMNQFDPNKKDNQFVMESSVGVNVLYIKIPKDLGLVGNIQYVK